MSGPLPFVILGHGAEDITKEFEERTKLPEGYTLVTLAECGAVTVLGTVNKFLDAFADPANVELFSNPAAPANKAAIQSILGNKIHVYRPGNLYPDLSVQALVDWTSEDEYGINLFQSGLYPFPMNPALLVEPRVKEHKFSKANRGIFSMLRKMPKGMREHLIELYNGSIFPTQAQVDYHLTETQETNGILNLNKFKGKITFSLSQFMEAGGPGIYFYVICRSPKEVPVREWVESYFVPHTAGQKALVKKFKDDVNVIPLIPEVFDEAKAMAKVETNRLALPGEKPKWNTENLLEMPAKLEKLYTVAMKTRKKSNAQQEEINAALASSGGGGGDGGAGASEGGRRRLRKKKTRRANKKRAHSSRRR